MAISLNLVFTDLRLVLQAFQEQLHQAYGFTVQQP